MVHQRQGVCGTLRVLHTQFRLRVLKFVKISSKKRWKANTSGKAQQSF